MKGPEDGANRHRTRSLAGRVLLVTGARPEVGRAIARAAEEQGARVALASPPSGDRGDDDAGRRVSADVGSEAGVDELFDAMADRGFHPDTLITVVPHPAGGPLGDLALEDWQARVIDPLRGLFWLCRRAVEEFLASGGPGRMIVLLEAPPSGEPDRIVVEALRSLARSLTREYGRRNMWFNVVIQAEAESESRVGGREGPDLGVQYALFLASDAASFVNGGTHVVARRSPRGSAVALDPRRGTGRS